jgi:hypothetical protein
MLGSFMTPATESISYSARATGGDVTRESVVRSRRGAAFSLVGIASSPMIAATSASSRLVGYDRGKKVDEYRKNPLSICLCKRQKM